MEYPCFIKRQESDENFSAYVISQEQHFQQLIGWGMPLPAESLEAFSIAQDAEKTKEQLQAECDTLDIEYDKRWGVEKLRQAIEAVK
jgi:hypothetical protein